MRFAFWAIYLFQETGLMAPSAALQVTFLLALLYWRTYCSKGKMWKEQ